ncbi:MAG TPA: thioredoxin domain-containing protein [Byssovorax sp.]|jgi:protein-disulfide isomerase
MGTRPLSAGAFARVRLGFVGVVALALAAGCDDASGKGAKAAGSASASASASAAATEVTLPGVDTAALTARERREWSAQVTELLAPCTDTPVSIAACVKEKRACKTCLPAAKLLLADVQAGRSKKECEDAYHMRFDPSKVKNIPTDGSPELGPPDAIVTIVEWADFDCPVCKAMAPFFEALVQKFPGQVKLVYRFFPLGGPNHPHGDIAARAAIAAQDQGKFWEMHHVLFENQERHEQVDLEDFARQLHLDMPKWKAIFVSKDAGERIEREKKAAEELGLDGTPFFFIDGRYVNSSLLNNPYADLVDWIKLDIELAGKVPVVAPDPSGDPAAGEPPAGSAAPSASAAASAAPSASAAAAPPKKK